jgi:preprotein translocase subunit SecA
MAGRGTDIALAPGVAELGGLHVIIAEGNDSGRIDRQLAGRCGRQGDPGRVWTMLSLEDGLAQRFLRPTTRRLLASLLLTQGAVARRLGRGTLARAQRRAEADAYARRRAVLRNDDWLDEALPFEAASGS